jgi:hypothetical protein
MAKHHAYWLAGLLVAGAISSSTCALRFGMRARTGSFDAPPDRFSDVVVSDGSGGRHDAPVYWNLWTTLATETSSTEAVTQLAESTSYRLYVDLSALRYDLMRPGLAESQSVSTPVLDALRDPVVEFDVVIFPDQDLFERPEGADWAKRMPVNTGRLLSYAGRDMPTDPFAVAGPMPDFRYGYVSFDLRTRAGVRVPTPGWIAVSVWIRDRPVEQLVTWRCVSSNGAGACRSPDPLFVPGGSALTAAGLHREQPDAGLHLISIGREEIWGVLHRRGESMQDALKWELGRRATIRHELAATLSTFNQTANVVGLGGDLLNVLFPSDQRGSDAARRAFEALVRERRAGAAPRTVVAKIDSSLAFPLALLAVDRRALGRDFLVEQPLERPPAVDSAGPCRLQWVALRPAPDNAQPPVRDGTLLQARDRLDQYDDLLLRRLREPSEEHFFDMDVFANWMRERNDPGHARRTGLIILSHHGVADADHLAFDEQHHIAPASFVRRFGDPSIAILDACGSGNPSAMGFVEHLEREGVASIIATATEVKAAMAVDFLHCFAREQGKIHEATALAKLYAQTLSCLRDTPETVDGPPHGDRAYAYMLLGDPQVPVCPLE